MFVGGEKTFKNRGQKGLQVYVYLVGGFNPFEKY